MVGGVVRGFRQSVGVAALLILLWTGAGWCAQASALRFGYPAIEDPTVTLGKYQKLLDAMAETIGVPVSLVQGDSYSEIVKGFERGAVDIGILNAFSYVEIGSRARLAPLARRVRAGRDTYQSYLVVREGAGIAGYPDLRGKVVAFPDARSTTGYLLPRLMLRRHRLEIPRDFARVLFVGKHDSTALAVANGTADVGALASYIHEELGPAIQAKLVILDRSEPIPFGPVVARADLGNALLGRIRTFFVTVDRTPQGQALLRDAKLSGFTAAVDRDYAPIRSLVRRLRSSPE
jgi:phosphonate transport system substrate-binding protein